MTKIQAPFTPAYVCARTCTQHMYACKLRYYSHHHS